MGGPVPSDAGGRLPGGRLLQSLLGPPGTYLRRPRRVSGGPPTGRMAGVDRRGSRRMAGSPVAGSIARPRLGLQLVRGRQVSSS